MIDGVQMIKRSLAFSRAITAALNIPRTDLVELISFVAAVPVSSGPGARKLGAQHLGELKLLLFFHDELKKIQMPAEETKAALAESSDALREWLEVGRTS